MILKAVFFAVCSLIMIATSTGQEIAKETMVYKTIDDRQLKIIVSKPTTWTKNDSRPAILFFHGGGWVGGKPGQFDAHCQRLIQKGIVCFQVEYRLLSKKDSGEDRTPTICINDAKSAMRWVRSRAAEFGIDPQRIASGGGSAGGHLAAFLGTTDGVDDPSDDKTISARSNAMLLFNPVYNNGPGSGKLKGWGTARVGDRFKEFSPAHNISGDDAPSIVFLGTQDNLIPVAVAQEFQNQMQQNKVRSELRLYANQGHGFFNASRQKGIWLAYTMEETIEFLESLGWIK